MTMVAPQAAEIELQSKQQLYDDLSDRSSLLLQESASVPDFNATAITDQVHSLQQSWLDRAKVQRDGRVLTVWLHL